ncbi:MAG: hypothetical protein QY307_04845 [Acidimicrobiia bacterium]|nr:MAG: hypothetical protein QY307_04845 [Acidimicrobiia bacterium]
MLAIAIKFGEYRWEGWGEIAVLVAAAGMVIGLIPTLLQQVGEWRRGEWSGPKFVLVSVLQVVLAIVLLRWAIALSGPQ